jgi:hypothetical protein
MDCGLVLPFESCPKNLLSNVMQEQLIVNRDGEKSGCLQFRNPKKKSRCIVLFVGAAEKCERRLPHEA